MGMMSIWGFDALPVKGRRSETDEVMRGIQGGWRVDHSGLKIVGDQGEEKGGRVGTWQISEERTRGKFKLLGQTL